MDVQRVTGVQITPKEDFMGFSRKPMMPVGFSKMELGRVQATGWLKLQLDLMKDGMSGRLSEISSFLQKENNGWETPGKEGWEEQPYWFRGFYSLAVQTSDEKLLEISNKWITMLIDGQDEDGWFGVSYNKSIKGADGSQVCDLWPNMIIIDALILYHEYTGDERIVTLMTRFFRFCAALSDAMFIPGYVDDFGDWHVCVQHDRACDMLPHIHWLYNKIGGEWLLDLGKRFFDANVPPKDEWLSHHVVNFTQMFRYPGSYALQTGEQWRLETSEYWYHQHMATWGQQPGGMFAADELLRKNNVDPRQGFETCAMVEFAKSFYILGRISGAGVYADRCESLFFNHFPAAQTPDLKGLHYLTASNQPILDQSENHEYTNKGRQVVYSAGETHRCCQHNVAMGWPWFVENLWQKTADNGMVAWMYGPSKLSCAVGGEGQTVQIVSDTQYPFRDMVRLTFYTEKPIKFPLYLRVPAWCEKVELWYNQKKVECGQGLGSYIRIENEFEQNDVLNVRFVMKIKAVRWPRNASVSIQRGPLFYSEKIQEEWRICGGTKEWPDYEVLPKTDWNYGLLCSELDRCEELSVTEHEILQKQPWTIENSPVSIQIKGKKIEGWGLSQNTVQELKMSPVRSTAEVETITLIPLGCARLRISCFPVITDDIREPQWENAKTAHLGNGIGVAYEPEKERELE